MTAIEDLEELNMYLAESREHLATIESDLLAMETAGAAIDEKLVNKVFRAAHSIKGGAGFFALKIIQELAHKVENVLDLVRSRLIVPNPEVVNILLIAFDRLRELVNDHANSNQADISEYLVALTGLTTSYLPPIQKETVQKMISISSPAGGMTLQVSEFDMQRAKEREEYVYLVEIDLIHDVQRRGKTPWEAFKEYQSCGTILECEFNFAAVGTLDDEGSNEIPLDIVFTSIIDPSFIASLFEGLAPEKISSIQGPAHPQPLLKALPGEPKSSMSEPMRTSALESQQPVADSARAADPVRSETPLMAADSVKAADPLRTEDILKGEDTLRVNINLLENLMNLAGELVLSRNQLQNAILREDPQLLRVCGQRINLVTSELQEAIMLTRMQPIGNILNKFPRVVRDLARERGKNIQLEITGKEVEIDKSLIEGLSEPLTHMVRNAVDHGIEDAAYRIAHGKKPGGRISLRAFHAAGQVVVEVADDGKGIDPQKVSQAAVKKGLLAEDQLKFMSEKEKIELIFMAGLSTAENVSAVSGRGVGMDVVKTNLDRLGGKVEIETGVGVGTTFRITLPLTLAIIPSLLVSVAGERFAIPQMNISEMIHVTAGQIKKRLEVIGDAEVLVLREKLVPILRLSDLFGIERGYMDPVKGAPHADRRERIADRRSRHSPYITPEDENQPAPPAPPADEMETERRSEADRRYHAGSDLDIVIISIGALEYGLVVDEMHDTLEIVVRPLGRHLKGCHEYTGATVLGDGHVALILDASGLAAKAKLKSLAGTSRAREIGEQESRQLNERKDLLSILLFHNSPSEACAIPLSYVERIEHIERGQVEEKGGRRTMQYRGSSLPLVKLNDMAQVDDLVEGAELVVLVMQIQGHSIGLLAAQPVDVIETPLVVDHISHRQKGIAGSCIIAEQTILVLDVEELAGAILGEQAPCLNPSPVAAGGATVLLVEDSGFFRGQVSRYLEGEGYRVLSAEDGQAGWDLLKQEVDNVRLVVTDIEMPVMNGLDLTRRIKADPATLHLPVIALTTLADEEDMAAGKSAGVSAYEIKLDKDKLLQTVRQMLLA